MRDSASRRRFGSGCPPRRAAPRPHRLAAREARCRCIGSHSWWPIVNTGFSEVIGSWKTQAMSCRAAPAARPARPSRSRPLEAIVPRRSAFSGSRLRMDMAVTLLPEPDFAHQRHGAVPAPRSSRRRRRGRRLRHTPRSPCGPCGSAREDPDAQQHHSRPAQLGDRASRSASVISEKAVTNTAMKAVAAASCHQWPRMSSFCASASMVPQLTWSTLTPSPR